MIVTTLQQQKYDITNPIKKFCIYDPLYMDNKDVSYVNNRIPSALVGKVVVKETRFEMEEDDKICCNECITCLEQCWSTILMK